MEIFIEITQLRGKASFVILTSVKRTFLSKMILLWLENVLDLRTGESPAANMLRM